MKKLGVIGNGFVGSAIIHGFVLHSDNIFIHDANPKKSTHSLGEVVNSSDVIVWHKVSFLNTLI